MEKYPLLLTLLGKDQLSTLVFTRTRERAEKVQEVLKGAGYKTALIHSDRTQGQRRQALEGFRRGQYRCLVATDIASRGLDVEDVGHVINFDLPHSPEDYVHRIGRTARAGASGRASTFITERDEETVRAIERITRQELPRVEVPREDAVFEEELEAFQGGEDEALLRELEDKPRARAPEKARPARAPEKTRARPARAPEKTRARPARAPEKTRARPARTSGGRSEGPERRGRDDSRSETPRRSGGGARGAAPRRERVEGAFGREDARRGKPARRGEGERGRDTARGAKGGRSGGPGRSGPRGPERTGGKGRRSGPPRGAGPSSSRGRGGGGRRGR
jgi:ATP-dependent RNA helicase RhlE